MANRRPLVRPAIVLERSVLGVQQADGFAVHRAAALAVSAWKRVGYLCVAVDCQPGRMSDALGARLEAARQRQIDAGLRGFGGWLDATFVYPRPGEEVDDDVPRASVYARLVLEAASALRIDLPRSALVALGGDAIAGARVAGIPSLLIASGERRPPDGGPQPGRVVRDLAAVRALLDLQRARTAPLPV